uniref:Uncharacterized protein n=1 Tax=Pan troglodytes TaxID=9598 RepID=G2HIF6_PANTR|nr:hypothetical protein [Pan troglodytes]
MPSGHERAEGAADAQSGARAAGPCSRSPSSRRNHPARALGASDCPHVLEESRWKILECRADELQHPSQSQLILPSLPLCSNRRWKHKKFDGFALGWEYLTHAQFQKGLQLSRWPRSRQNGLLLPAKEHRQHTHLQPGTSHAGPRTEEPAEFGF